MNELQNLQVKMHKDFFDKCKLAIENGFYIEAILIEYAAIESRLEAICGMIGFPCGNNCDNRKDINISHRIKCLRNYYLHNNDVVEKSKLSKKFFQKNGELQSWIKQRNIIVHGLYKNATDYQKRINDNKRLSEEGYIIVRQLYNEAKRISRIRKNHIDKFARTSLECKEKKCKGNK